MKIHVNVRQSTNPEGWSASIARTQTKGDKEIAMGESILYPTKEAAWESIQKKAETLDYENDEILINSKPVGSFSDLKAEVDTL